MVEIDCTVLSCIPVELYGFLIGISIATAIFGFMKNPQVPVMLTIGGAFIFVIGVMFNGLLLGVQPDSSTSAGATTTYDMVNNGFDMSGFTQVLVALMGAFLMLVSGVMTVVKR